MNISDFVQADSILLNLEVNSKDELLARLFAAMKESSAYNAQTAAIREQIQPMILQRESYGSTALGNGILFPHARVPGFAGQLLLLATCKKPIEMETPDGQPISIVFLVVMPAERPSLALKVASTLARLFSDEEARYRLRSTATPQRVVEYIQQHDITVDTIIHVRDVYRPYEWTASPDTPVREIARQMLQNRMPGVAVVDDDGKLLGEVTITRLERFGLPNFFHSLKSVSFVRQFDPFEQYFLKEAESTAQDVMNEDIACLPEDGTLMEAIHALAVKRRAMVHICRDGHAIGYVDGVVVLNRVLSP